MLYVFLSVPRLWPHHFFLAIDDDDALGVGLDGSPLQVVTATLQGGRMGRCAVDAVGGGADKVDVVDVGHPR